MEGHDTANIKSENNTSYLDTLAASAPHREKMTDAIYHHRCRKSLISFRIPAVSTCPLS